MKLWISGKKKVWNIREKKDNGWNKVFKEEGSDSIYSKEVEIILDRIESY